jgi:hypothetical protein
MDDDSFELTQLLLDEVGLGLFASTQAANLVFHVIKQIGLMPLELLRASGAPIVCAEMFW